MNIFTDRNNFPSLTGDGLLLFVADATPFQDKDIQDLLYSWLSQTERERYTRFRFDSHRHTFLISRGILRSVLGHYTANSPEKVLFRITEKGKPLLDMPQRMAFNLSHSGSHIALAIGEVKGLGVDIQNYKDPGISLKDLAEYCLSPDEYEQFLSLQRGKGKAAAERHFTKLWTLKEAYLKALGVGLSKALRSFSFLLQAEQGEILFQDHEKEENGTKAWEFFLCTDFEAFPLSLAWKGSLERADHSRKIQLFTPEKTEDRRTFSWQQKEMVQSMRQNPKGIYPQDGPLN